MQMADNEGITFTGRPHTSPKLIAISFNRQLTTSKQGKHSSSWMTCHVSKDVKRMTLEEAESFTSDQVTSAIKICRSSRAYGPDSLIIFHLKNLGTLATEHLTTLYNDSLKSCLISHPDSQAQQGLITRHFLPTHLAAMPSCLCPRGAHLTLYQRISLTSYRSTQLQTQTLNYIYPPPAHSRHRDRLQPAETSSPYSVCGHRPDSCI